MPPAKLTPPTTSDPIEFWEAQHAQAVKDAKAARSKAPSVLPKLVQLEREAWQELQAARRRANPPEAAPTPADMSLEGQLANIRQMREEAQAKGSLTIAGHLVKMEGELAEQIRQREEAAAKSARAARTPDEVAAALATKVKTWPEGLQAKFRAALGW